ncbi:MAG: LCP family protein, partial [Lachnospiraceae bacterium]
YNIVDNDGFPFEGSRTTGKVGAKGSCVIPVDLQTNVVKLHQFLFEQNDYTVSNELSSYSKKVSSDTGF